MDEIELCIICDEATGNAGILEDSLYDIDGCGPYCDECFNKLSNDLKSEK